MGSRDKPSVEYCRELLSHIQNYWPIQMEFDRLRLEMYWENDPVTQEDTLNPNRRRRIAPERMTANELRREIDLIVSLFPYPAEIGVQYIGPGARSAAASERVELGLNEAIDQLNPPIDSPLLRGRWSMCLLGREARMIVPGHLYWWDAPKLEDFESLDDWNRAYTDWHGQAPLPVTWADLPAESTFPPSFGSIDEELVSWQTVLGYDLLTMFSKKELGDIFSSDADYSQPYTLVLYSNREWLAYGVISGGESPPTTPASNTIMAPTSVDRLVRTVEHKLGVPAIQILPGVTSGKKDVGRFWQGVSDSSISLIRAANRRLSEAATASKFDALPILKSWLHEDTLVGEGAETDNKVIPQGDIIPLRPEADGMGKEDIQPLFQPQFGDKTLALAQFALARAERNSGAVEALEGATGPSGEPAWSRNSIIEQAKMKQSRLAQAVAAADLNAAEMISRSIQSFGADIQLTPTTSKTRIVLKPDDLKNYRVILKSEFKMQLPVSRRADIQLGVSVMEQARRSGIPISPAWVMENVMDISRPLEEFKNSVTWDLLLSDESRNFYRKLLVKEAEMDLSEEEGMALEEFQQVADQRGIPQDVVQQFLQLASQGQTPPGGGQIPGAGNSSRMARAGIPFSTNPTGPQPEQELPPVGA